MDNILNALTGCVSVLNKHGSTLNDDEKQVLNQAEHALKVANRMCYAILKPMNKDLHWWSQHDIYGEEREHIVPDTNPDHKYILLERSIDDHQCETYTNAWSSNDLESLLLRAKSYRSYFDYINEEAILFDGSKIKLT